MTEKKQSDTVIRPLRVLVGSKTKAEKGFHSRKSMPNPDVIAPGLPATPKQDLIFHGGKTIQDLVFTNFYVGGTKAWQISDIQSIDQALSAAMSDQNLNNVMCQYYPSDKITSTFRGSQILGGTPPQTVSQGDVESLVRTLFQAGTLSSFDFTSTVFNFILPRGTILNINAAPTTSTITAQVESFHSIKEGVKSLPDAIPVEEEEDSTQGLGGYHGSVHLITSTDTKTVYYAVGVYSETLPNGSVNGIPVFKESWKNVVATFYHELNEARTDPDVEDAIKAGNAPRAVNFLGWVSSTGEECGDFPVREANPLLSKVFQEIELTDGSRTVPIQYQYSNADHGPGQPRNTPAPFAG